MSTRLANLIASVFERPENNELGELESLDELLCELTDLPRSEAMAELVDDLLDYRAVLSERVALIDDRIEPVGAPGALGGFEAA